MAYCYAAFVYLHAIQHAGMLSGLYCAGVPNTTMLHHSQCQDASVDVLSLGSDARSVSYPEILQPLHWSNNRMFTHLREFINGFDDLDDVGCSGLPMGPTEDRTVDTVMKAIKERVMSNYENCSHTLVATRQDRVSADGEDVTEMNLRMEMKCDKHGEYNPLDTSMPIRPSAVGRLSASCGAKQPLATVHPMFAKVLKDEDTFVLTLMTEEKDPDSQYFECAPYKGVKPTVQYLAEDMQKCRMRSCKLGVKCQVTPSDCDPIPVVGYFSPSRAYGRDVGTYLPAIPLPVSVTSLPTKTVGSDFVTAVCGVVIALVSLSVCFRRNKDNYTSGV